MRAGVRWRRCSFNRGRETGVAETQYLVIEEAADLLRMSVRAVHERTRTKSIPMRKMAATRKLLFVRDELVAFMDGAELEVTEKSDGSIIVKPACAKRIAA
jgi:hypothetical protein